MIKASKEVKDIARKKVDQIEKDFPHIIESNLYTDEYIPTYKKVTYALLIKDWIDLTDYIHMTKENGELASAFSS